MHTKHGLESHVKKYLLNTSLYQAHMYRFTTNFQGKKLAELTIKTLKTGQLKQDWALDVLKNANTLSKYKTI